MPNNLAAQLLHAEADLDAARKEADGWESVAYDLAAAMLDVLPERHTGVCIECGEAYGSVDDHHDRCACANALKRFAALGGDLSL